MVFPIVHPDFIKTELMLASSDIHPNPGQFDNSLKFCHWNLNGGCTQYKIKIPLLEAYDSIFHFDLIALSKTNLNEVVKNEDIIINDFCAEIFRSDHHSGDKQGRVCVDFNPISTGGRCFPCKFCLPVDNFFSFESIATKFGDFS